MGSNNRAHGLQVVTIIAGEILLISNLNKTNNIDISIAACTYSKS